MAKVMFGQSSRKYSVFFVSGLAGASALLASLVPVLGSYADQRFVLVGLIGVLALFPSKKQSWAAKFGGVVYFLGIALTSLQAEVSVYGFSELGMYALFPVAVIGLASLINSSADSTAHKAVLALVSSAVCYAALTPAIYLFSLADEVARLDDYLPWGFINIRYWGHTASWLLPLMPVACFVGNSHYQRVWKLFVTLGAGVWWWLILISSSRGTLLSVTLSGVVLVGVFGKHVLLWVRPMLKQFLIGVAIWVALSAIIPWLLFDSLEMRSVGSGDSGRFRLWVEAWRMSLERFPIGMGPQAWITEPPLTEGYLAGKKLAHPHNMYLMLAAEYGWMSVFGLVLIGGGCLLRLTRVRHYLHSGDLSHKGKILRMSLVASMCAGFVHAGASAVFMAPSSMLIALIVISLFWALVMEEGEGWGGKYSGSRKQYLLKTCLLTPLVLFWVYGVSIYYVDMQKDWGWYSRNVYQGTLPRFWVHGNFPRQPALMPDESR